MNLSARMALRVSTHGYRDSYRDQREDRIVETLFLDDLQGSRFRGLRPQPTEGEPTLLLLSRVGRVGGGTFEELKGSRYPVRVSGSNRPIGPKGMSTCRVAAFH